MKICTKCQNIKDESDFSKKNNNRLQSACKSCLASYRREVYRKRVELLGGIVNQPKPIFDKKICFQCKIEKPIQDFWKTKYRAYRSQCIQCDRLSTKNVRIKNQKLLAELKDKPCIDCGIKYPPYVMEFDHVKEKKYKNVSLLVTSKNKMLNEIEKCELVCANCHRERTHKRRIA